jgi:hypothetical protein
VNQPTRDVKRKSQQPQNQQNYKDCPKHLILQCSLIWSGTLGKGAKRIIAPPLLDY